MYTTAQQFEDMFRLPGDYAMGDGVNRRRRPVAPAAPPRASVAEMLAAQAAAEQSANAQLGLTPAAVLPGMPAGVTSVPDAPAPPIASQVGPPGVVTPHVGQPTKGLNSLGKKLAQYHATQDAGLGSKVAQTPWGYEEQPPERNHPSRLREALEGALTGGAIAGVSGPTEGTLARMLGGAATGGIAGAVKPTLVQQFGRDLELAKLQGEVGAEQAIELKNAQIDDTAAQAEARTQAPELAALRIQHQMDAETARQRDREVDNQRADRQLGVTTAANTERVRHNKAMENRKPRRFTSMNGQFWEEDENGVMRVKAGSPAATPSASAAAAADRKTVRGEEKAAKSRQAAALYQKGSDYWDQAQAKRKEAETLSTKKFLSDAEKSRLSSLTREAEGLESKTREVQLQGDKLAAESESTATDSGGGAKTFNLRAWKADHPNATAAEIAAKKAQYPNYRFVE